MLLKAESCSLGVRLERIFKYAQSHSAVNSGKTEVKLVVVELQESPKKP